MPIVTKTRRARIKAYRNGGQVAGWVLILWPDSLYGSETFWAPTWQAAKLMMERMWRR